MTAEVGLSLLLSTLQKAQLRRGDGMFFHTGRSLVQKGGAAIDVLHYLHRQGSHVDSYTYVRLLQRCMEMKDLASGRHVHDHIARSRAQPPNNHVINTLIKMYTHCGSVAEARQVFNESPEKTVVSWNAIVGGYAQHGHTREAFRLFCQMQRGGLEPNRITYMSILNTCASPGALKWGKEVHAQAVNAGLASDVRVGTALVNMYAKCGSIHDARHVFDRIVKRNVISWNVMIGGYADSGHGEEAFKVFHEMRREGCLEPDKITYINILNACARPAALGWGREVHAGAVSAGFASDMRVANALINMYAKCGTVNAARRVFDIMVRRDVISWNAMVGGYAESGRGDEAFEVFDEMQREGVEPDRITYMNILNACARPAALAWGKAVHAQITKARFSADVRVATALVNMYVKCGSINDARKVFDKMVKRNPISWTAMIGGYAECGQGEEVFALFHQMRREGLEPTKVTYISILNACASPAALNLGEEVHAQAMRAGFASDMSVRNALVNMYSKCGSVQDARRVFNGMAKPQRHST